LLFDHNCREALEMYQRILGATVDIITTFSESPVSAHLGPEWSDKVMHSAIRVGGSLLMAADSPYGYETPRGFMIALSIAEPPEAERAFAMLADGGQMAMPMQETPSMARFGMCTDRFGVPWMVSCEKPK
jgi:PhnB protein